MSDAPVHEVSSLTALVNENTTERSSVERERESPIINSCSRGVVQSLFIGLRGLVPPCMQLELAYGFAQISNWVG